MDDFRCLDAVVYCLCRHLRRGPGLALRGGHGLSSPTHLIMMAVEQVHEDFSVGVSPRWQRYVIGSGALQSTGESLRFVNIDTTSHQYTNAQIDDYQNLPRCEFLWRPPLTLVVQARFSHPVGELRGTAGFGFWNDPFMMMGSRLPTFPRAIWFFYASPPSNMKLDLQTPGRGWKAATVDARRWPFFLLVPTAPLAIPLMNLKSVYRLLWPLGQRAIGACEGLAEVDITQWHAYTIEWGIDEARFKVDGDVVLQCTTSPGGPLGFVTWLDNQYAVVTPWGRCGYGQLDAPGRQWMELAELTLTP